MDKASFIRRVLAITDEGWATLDAGMAYDSLIYNNVLLCAENAFRWLVQNAPDDMLWGKDLIGQSEQDPGIVIKISNLTWDNTNKVAKFPSNFVRLLRLRCTGWNRALSHKDLIMEDSEEYMMMANDPHMGSNDHPYAVYYRDSAEPKISMSPAPSDLSKIEASYIVIPDNITSSLQESSFAFPPKLQNALIYYTAYLVLVGYGDTKAQSVLQVVYNELGITPNQPKK